MRLLVAPLILLSAAVQADRYFTVPMGRKIPLNTYRLDVSFNPHNRGPFEESLTVGVTKTVEIELRRQAMDSSGARTALDLSYNLLGPIADISPGISVGVQDCSDATADGLRGYVAVTYRKIFFTANGDANGDLTIGGYIGTHSTALVGFNLPLSQEVRWLFEHNGYRISTGIEVRPMPQIAIRYYLRDINRLLGLSWTAKF